MGNTFHQDVAASCYQPSFRSYPAKTPELEYGAGVTIRRVRSNGEIKWQGGRVYLSEALQGERVGLVPQDNRFWTIQLGPVQIGLLDAYGSNVLHIPTQVLPMCPV